MRKKENKENCQELGPTIFETNWSYLINHYYLKYQQPASSINDLWSLSYYNSQCLMTIINIILQQYF